MTYCEPRLVKTFFALTFVLALPVYVLLGLTVRGVILVPELAVAWIPAATLAPFIAALILVYRSGGLASIWKLMLRTFDIQKATNRIWLVAGLIVPPITIAFSWAVAMCLGLDLLAAGASLAAAPIAFLVFFGGAMFEELGWMGVAYEPMENKWGAIKSALIMGVLIALFHIPLYYFIIEDTAMFAVQILFPIALRVFVVWVYENAGKSIFAAIILHASFNTSFAIFEVNSIIATAISAIVAATIIVLWRPLRKERVQT